MKGNSTLVNEGDFSGCKVVFQQSHRLISSFYSHSSSQCVRIHFSSWDPLLIAVSSTPDSIFSSFPAQNESRRAIPEVQSKFLFETLEVGKRTMIREHLAGHPFRKDGQKAEKRRCEEALRGCAGRRAVEQLSRTPSTYMAKSFDVNLMVARR